MNKWAGRQNGGNIGEEQNKEKKRERIEDNLRDLWDNTKRTNIRIMGSQKKKRKRKGLRKYLKRL